VLAAAIGSTIGVLLLDLVCRNGGEELLKRLVKPKLLDYLKRQMEQHATAALIVTCLAPPPFPFGAFIAAASAFQYPRPRLLILVFVARAVRFSLVGWAAIYFGRQILRIADSTDFLWAMGGFIALCVIGSIVSVIHWIPLRRLLYFRWILIAGSSDWAKARNPETGGKGPERRSVSRRDVAPLAAAVRRLHKAVYFFCMCSLSFSFSQNISKISKSGTRL
jgi:hypothetical protein